MLLCHWLLIGCTSFSVWCAGVSFHFLLQFPSIIRVKQCCIHVHARSVKRNTQFVKVLKPSADGYDWRWGFNSNFPGFSSTDHRELLHTTLNRLSLCVDAECNTVLDVISASQAQICLSDPRALSLFSLPHLVGEMKHNEDEAEGDAARVSPPLHVELPPACSEDMAPADWTLNH